MSPVSLCYLSHSFPFALRAHAACGYQMGEAVCVHFPSLRFAHDSAHAKITGFNPLIITEQQEENSDDNTMFRCINVICRIEYFNQLAATTAFAARFQLLWLFSLPFRCGLFNFQARIMILILYFHFCFSLVINSLFPSPEQTIIVFVSVLGC